jgi:hypothetical protein
MEVLILHHRSGASEWHLLLGADLQVRLPPMPRKCILALTYLERGVIPMLQLLIPCLEDGRRRPLVAQPPLRAARDGEAIREPLPNAESPGAAAQSAESPGAAALADYKILLSTIGPLIVRRCINSSPVLKHDMSNMMENKKHVNRIYGKSRSRT